MRDTRACAKRAYQQHNVAHAPGTSGACHVRCPSLLPRFTKRHKQRNDSRTRLRSTPRRRTPRRTRKRSVRNEDPSAADEAQKTRSREKCCQKDAAALCAARRRRDSQTATTAAARTTRHGQRLKCAIMFFSEDSVENHFHARAAIMQHHRRPRQPPARSPA